jgi:hypothetical protein
VTTMFKETEWYIGGNAEHLGKPKRYVATPRETLKLLHAGKIHVFSVDQRVEFLSDATLAGEGRLKVLADGKKLFASNEGLYYLT